MNKHILSNTIDYNIIYILYLRKAVTIKSEQLIYYSLECFDDYYFLVEKQL